MFRREASSARGIIRRRRLWRSVDRLHKRPDVGGSGMAEVETKVDSWLARCASCARLNRSISALVHHTIDQRCGSGFAQHPTHFDCDRRGH